jgi:hypothetical protein
MPFATPGGVADALAPVPTVPPTAPPLHRSPMRAAVVASLAAGASVAAAWGLAVSPLPGGVRAPVAGIPSGVASFGAVNYSSGLPSLSTPRAEATRLGTGRFGGVAGARSFWLVSSTPGIVMQGVPASSVRISVVTSAQSRP